MASAKTDLKGTLNLRLTPEVLGRADALVEHLKAVQGRACTRSDVVREAIVRGLRALESDRRHADTAKADSAGVNAIRTTPGDD